MKSKSTTPAGTGFCNSLIRVVLRPPLLQKEGKVGMGRDLSIQNFNINSHLLLMILSGKSVSDSLS